MGLGEPESKARGSGGGTTDKQRTPALRSGQGAGESEAQTGFLSLLFHFVYI